MKHTGKLIGLPLPSKSVDSGISGECLLEGLAGQPKGVQNVFAYGVSKVQLVPD